MDATTGQEKWKYDLPGDDIPAMRGGAYWKGGAGLPPSLIFGSRAGKLYSLRLADGKLNSRFAEDGILNLKTPEVMQTGMKLPYNLSSPPAIYRNIAITD